MSGQFIHIQKSDLPVYMFDCVCISLSLSLSLCVCVQMCKVVSLVERLVNVRCDLNKCQLSLVIYPSNSLTLYYVVTCYTFRSDLARHIFGHYGLFGL